MKAGDLVLLHCPGEASVIGVFLRAETGPYSANPPTRARVFWDGDVYSTPLDQLEVVSESR